MALRFPNILRDMDYDLGASEEVRTSRQDTSVTGSEIKNQNGKRPKTKDAKEVIINPKKSKSPKVQSSVSVVIKSPSRVVRKFLAPTAFQVTSNDVNNNEPEGQTSGDVQSYLLKQIADLQAAVLGSNTG